MSKIMKAWLPGMDEPSEEAQRLVYKFETEGGIVAEVDESNDNVRIELSDGQSFWIDSVYLERMILN